MKQPPGSTARTTILTATASLLDEGGEANAKLAQVAHRAKVTARTVQRHFGGVRSVIDAAQAYRFDTSALAAGSGIAHALRAADDETAIRDAIDETLRAALAPEGVSARMRRANVLSVARHRLDLASHVAATAKRERLDLEDAIADAQRRRRIATKVDAAAAAILVRASLFGLLQRDLMPRLADGAAATVVLRRVLHHLLLGSEPDGPFDAPHDPHPIDPRVTPFERPGDRVADGIVKAAARALAEGGEDALAITRLARAIEVNPVTIYRWFTDGQGVAEHAWACRFSETTFADVAIAVPETALRSRTALRDALPEAFAGIVADAHRSNRVLRAELLGAAHARPLMLATVNAAHQAFIHEARTTYATWNETTNLGIDPTALAVYTSGLVTGLAMTDVEADRVPAAAWLASSKQLLVRLFRLDAAARRAVPEVPHGDDTDLFAASGPSLPRTTSDGVSPRNATHAAILETGHDVLRSEGLPALTVSRIADALGIAASNVAYYYPHRDMLVQALAARLLASIERTLHDTGAAFEPRDDDGDWAERFVAAATERMLHPTVRHTLRTLTAIANEDHELSHDLHQRLDAFPRIVLEQGGIDPDAPRNQPLLRSLHVTIRYLAGEALTAVPANGVDDGVEPYTRRAIATLAPRIGEAHEAALRRDRITRA